MRFVSLCGVQSFVSSKCQQMCGRSERNLHLPALSCVVEIKTGAYSYGVSGVLSAVLESVVVKDDLICILRTDIYIFCLRHLLAVWPWRHSVSGWP